MMDGNATSRKKARTCANYDISIDTPTKDILEYLSVLHQAGDKEGLENAYQRIEEVFRKKRRTMSDKAFDEWSKLSSEIAYFIRSVEKTREGRVVGFGKLIKSLGFGSSAGKSNNRAKVDDVITSFQEGDYSNIKGAMLSHFFYRKFLEHIHNPSSFQQSEEMEKAKKKFMENTELIWNEGRIGIVRHKIRGGATTEAAATSLLTACINQLISALVSKHCKENEEIFISWASEYPLHVKDQDDPSKKHREPRTDGILVAADPAHANALRAVASMKAKLHTYDENARYQSRSNAIDAFSQQDSSADPWPLLMFRVTLGHRLLASVEVLAFVPLDEWKAKEVLMWKSSDKDAVFQSVVAATMGTIEFVRLQQGPKPAKFCSIHGNLAVDNTELKIYKSFFETERRSANIALIQCFVDDTAEEMSLGGKGSYTEMKWVGKIFDDDAQCRMVSFLQIAQDLKRLHGKGVCHGDIRVSNLILDPVDDNKAKLIDFDLAGKTGIGCYPDGLCELVDGKRHPDVESAIREGRAGRTVLNEAHDWFSLAAAMKCFDVVDNKDSELWRKLVDCIGDGRIDHLDSKDFLEKKVKLNADVERGGIEATGSPDKV